LEALSEDLTPLEVAQVADGFGALNGTSPQAWADNYARTKHLNQVASIYQATTVPLQIHLFVNEEIALEARTLGWDLVLPNSRIRVAVVPGNHITMMADPRGRALLGATISESLVAEQPISSSMFNPLYLLQPSRKDVSPLFCIPGAGASITSFAPFVAALADDRPVYGLQPRGIDPVDVPCGSVEVACRINLRAIDDIKLTKPIHLMGHSHGGLVAFDMALQLEARGMRLNSLTLIDTAPPSGSESDSLCDVPPHVIAKEFVNALRWQQDPPLEIDSKCVDKPEIELLQYIRDLLVKAKIVSPRTDAEFLKGPLATFGAALRSQYRNTALYTGRAHLVLLADPDLNATDNKKRWDAMVAGWRGRVTNLDVVIGSGHHFSALREPHVIDLVRWWRELFQLPAGTDARRL
jgi:thioesterase domain-containing protein